MTFKEFNENYDGCIYIICFENEVLFSVFHYYFMKYENAIEYLWEYYLDHEGKEASPDDREHALMELVILTKNTLKILTPRMKSNEVCS